MREECVLERDKIRREALFFALPKSDIHGWDAWAEPADGALHYDLLGGGEVARIGWGGLGIHAMGFFATFALVAWQWATQRIKRMIP